MNTTHKFINKHREVLYIRADFAQASSPIQFSWDGDEFHGSPFQVADAQHWPIRACKLIAGWGR